MKQSKQYLFWNTIFFIITHLCILTSCASYRYFEQNTTVTWPSFRGSPHNSGFTETNMAPPLILEWLFPNNSIVIRSTIAATLNKVYLPDWNGNIWILNAVTGKPESQIITPSLITSSPAIDKNRLFVGGCDSVFYAFDLNRKQILWEYRMNHISVSSPQVDHHSVYFGAHDQSIYCLHKNNGRLRWKIIKDSIIPSSPAIHGEYLFFTSADSMVYCVRKKNGDVNWKTCLDHNTWATPVIIDSILVVGDIQGTVYALIMENGSVLWKTSLDAASFKNHPESHPLHIVSTAATDGKRIYINTSEGHIVCIDPESGNIYWMIQIIDCIFSAPLISKEYIYITTMSERLLIMNKLSGEILQSIPVTGSVYASPVISGSRLFFGTEKGYFYAFQSNAENHRQHPGSSY